jgi:Skp family chaperone for outer membrane proteins
MKKLLILFCFIWYAGLAIAQSNEKSGSSTLNNAATVNFVKVVNSIRGRDKTLVAQEANVLLDSIIQKGDVSMLFKNVAYTSPDVDITEKVISSLSSGGAGNSVEISDSKLHPLVIFINREKVFNVSNQARQMQEKLRNEFGGRQNSIRDEALGIKNDAEKILSNKATIDPGEYRALEIALAKRDRELQAKVNVFKRELNRRTFEERNEIAKKVNPVIAQLAKIMGASIVLQEVVYANPPHDLTDTLISVLNQEKTLEQVTAQTNAKVPLQIGFIDTEKVFSSFPQKNGDLSEEGVFNHRNEISLKINPMLKAYAEKNGLDIVVQSPDAIADKRFDITSRIIDLTGAATESGLIKSPAKNESINLLDAKQKCIDLGFKEKTEAFGKCVLRISK